MDNEVEDEDLDVEQQASRNNRGVKENTELYYFVLALFLNEITTNYESLSTKQRGIDSSAKGKKSQKDLEKERRYT